MIIEYKKSPFIPIRYILQNYLPTFVGLLLISASTAGARAIFVDKQLEQDCHGNYSIMLRNGQGNDGDAYKNISGAAAAAMAGDTVFLRQGTYTEQLSPKSSGAINAYITYMNWNDEQVVLTDYSLSPAIWIYEKDYIRIQGLEVIDVRRWLNALGCTNIEIIGNKFQNANDIAMSSKTGLFFQYGSHNRILNNTMDSTTEDNLVFVGSDYNLVEGNRITRAGHTLWAIKCGNYNIIRNNYFHNPIQKIGEIYDCYNVGHDNDDPVYKKINSLDDCKHNLVENNVFAYTSSPVDRSPYSGIQFAGQHCIIRRNSFYNCRGPGIAITIYPEEALNNYGNRIYNNVFYNNRHGAMTISAGDGDKFADNVILNNIIYKNCFDQQDFRWTWYDTLAGKPVQIMTGRNSEVTLQNNAIYSSGPDELWLIAYGNRNNKENPEPQTIEWWQSNHPDFMSNNLETDPMLRDTAEKDFSLQAHSPMIDAGRFLSTAISSGHQSTEMTVGDAKYFCPGYGLVEGDTVQLKGQTAWSIITDIDYASNTLYLATALSWKSGQGISLKFSGPAPDIGAFEYIVTDTTAVSELLQHQDEVLIYPNPTRGIIEIECRAEQGDILNIELLNGLGEKLMNWTASQSRQLITKTIDLHDFANGIYYLHISNGNKSSYHKILKIE